MLATSSASHCTGARHVIHHIVQQGIDARRVIPRIKQLVYSVIVHHIYDYLYPRLLDVTNQYCRTCSNLPQAPSSSL